MTAVFLCAAALASACFTVTPVDGGRAFALSSTKPVEELRDVRCRWILYRDGLPAANGRWNIAGFGAGHAQTNAAPPVLAALRAQGGDFALRVRFVKGAEDPDKETLLAISQYDYPGEPGRRLSAFLGAPAKLTETASAYEFKTPSQRIRFDRGTGLLSGFATGWWSSTEWLARPMAFDFGDPSPRIRLETFTPPAETNGVWSFRTVSWWTMSEKKNFEIRVATDWQVRGDGRVVSRTAIRPFGLPHVLPRVGWAFVLAPPGTLVQYYGENPPAESKDSSLAGLTGLYSSASVGGCGSHARTRGVSFDAGLDHFSLSTLGGNFFLEVGETASQKTFCGISAAQQTDSDRDFRIDLLISPEKTLKALLPPAEEGRAR